MTSTSFCDIDCPHIRELAISYHWSIMQVEYATDLVFLHQRELTSIYDVITRNAIHIVKPENVATFLGRKLHGNYQDELGNDFRTRIEGTRIRHHMGPASIKMYDKFSLVLRIETTANDVSFFKHHRKVEHRNGQSIYKLAPLKKSIYSLGDLRKILKSSNQRYLEFISAIEDPSIERSRLNKVCESKKESDRTYKGFNFFSDEDQHLFETIVRGEYNIYGFRNSDLRNHLHGLNAGQVSRLLKRLRIHGLIKKVGRTYKYYVTSLGKRVVMTGLKLKHLFIIPALGEPVVANG